MAESQWQLGVRNLAIRDLKIGPADGASTDLHQDQALPAFAAWQSRLTQLCFRSLKNHCVHQGRLYLVHVAFAHNEFANLEEF